MLEDNDCAVLRAAYRAKWTEVERLAKTDILNEDPIFGKAVDAEVDARDALAGAPCKDEAALVANASCIYELVGGDWVEWQETIAELMENYLRAAGVKKKRRQCF